MRSFRPWKCVAVLVVLAAGVGSVAACGCEPPGPFTLPGEVKSSVVGGLHFVAVTDGGRLVVADLFDNKVRDLGTLDKQLVGVADVGLHKALVTSASEAHLIDLQAGKVERSFPLEDRPRGLGLIDQGRAFVHAGNAVSILDLSTGKVLHRVELPKGLPLDGLGWHHRAFNGRLYVAGDALHIIDAGQGKLVGSVRTGGTWAGGLHVNHREAFVLDLVVSCGFMVKGLTRIDLATKKATELPLPRDTNRRNGLVGEQGGLPFVAAGNRAVQVDGNGKHRAEATWARGRMVGSWMGHAAILDGRRLTFVETSMPAVKAAAAR